MHNCYRNTYLYALKGRQINVYLRLQRSQRPVQIKLSPYEDRLALGNYTEVFI